MTLPANLLGQTLCFKFQSFNVFGGGLEDLSTCLLISSTGRRAADHTSDRAQLESGFPLDLGQVIDGPTCRR